MRQDMGRGGQDELETMLAPAMAGNAAVPSLANAPC
jgi:hypothetical protein